MLENKKVGIFPYNGKPPLFNGEIL